MYFPKTRQNDILKKKKKMGYLKKISDFFSNPALLCDQLLLWSVIFPCNFWEVLTVTPAMKSLFTHKR